MKLIIQIPCFNEAETLPQTLADLPRDLPGFTSVQWLIIDDGSADDTAEVARRHGVDHVVCFRENRGLAAAFLAGLDAAVKLGADVVVNTDGDNQYCGEDIALLVAPIRDGLADVVVGDRQVEKISHFSPTKIRLQKFGSWVIRQASTTSVPDATSGFRAMTRDVAQRTTLNNRFSYTLETIIQAGAAGRKLVGVPIRTNPKTRDSRLFRSIPSYIRKSVGIIVRIYTMHRPLKAFFFASLPFLITGLVLGLRWCWFFFTTDGPTGHVQSLLVAAGATVVGVQVLLFGLLGDLLAANRRLSEEVLYRVRELERVQLHGGDATPPTQASPEPESPAKA